MPATLNSFFSFLSAIIPTKVQKRARTSSNFARNSDKFGRKLGRWACWADGNFSEGLAGARTKWKSTDADCRNARLLLRRIFFLLSAQLRFFGGLLSGGGQGSAQFGNGAFGALCYIPKPSFFARASARSRTAFSARSISAFRAAMFSFAIFERSASVYKNAPSKLPHVGSIL